MENSKNILIFTVISVAILAAYFLVVLPLVSPPPPPQQQQQTQTPAQTGGESRLEPAAPGTEGGEAQPGPTEPTTEAAPALRDRAAVLAETGRVTLANPLLTGSISLKGGALDDLTLTQYRAELDPKSPAIVLLSPRGAADAYFTAFRWAAADGTPVPDAGTEWQADGNRLAPGTPVTLSWSNGEGQRFELAYELDDKYLLTVTQRVVNEGEKAVALAPYALVNRTGKPPADMDYIVHKGPISVLDETYTEYDYDDVEDAKNGTVSQKTTGGWLGFADKYWSVLLVPQQDAAVDVRFVFDRQGRNNVYQADATYTAATIEPGQSSEETTKVFAGARVPAIVDAYDDVLGAPKFYLAVDYGWIFFLSRPIYIALDWFNSLVGNFGVAILLLVVCVRILLFPLANKAYKSMARMRKLQPKMLELRERYKEDRQRFQQEMMQLYRKEGANPLAGCLPILVQIPIFIALYNVLYGTIEMRHAPFFGWIQDLSAPDPTSWINLFGLLPYNVPDLGILNLVSLGAWPIFMGITMWLQYRLNPQPTDPMQAKIFAWMPVIFTFMLGQFAAGLVIYWAWNNTLSMAQQAFIMHRQGLPIGRKAQAAAAATSSAAPAKEKPKAPAEPSKKKPAAAQPAKASQGSKAKRKKS